MSQQENNDGGVVYRSHAIGGVNPSMFSKDLSTFMMTLNPVNDTIISVSHSSAPYKSPNTYQNEPAGVMYSVVIVWKHIP